MPSTRADVGSDSAGEPPVEAAAIAAGPKVARRVALLALLVGPVVLVLLAFTYLPIVRSFLLSTSDASLLRPGGSSSVGLQNFRDVLGSPRFARIAGNTLLWTVLSVTGSTLLGVAGAMVLSTSIRGKSLMRALMLVPWLAPPVASAFVWRYLYRDGMGGPLNSVLTEVGLIDRPVGFLTDASSSFLGVPLPMWSVIQVSIWAGFGFIMLFTLSAMSGVPQVLYEAAALDGANAWRRFRDVTLPLIAPVLETAVLLMVLYRLGSFDLPFLLTHGKPDDITNVLGVYIYDTSFASFELGKGAALGLILLVAGAPIGAWYVRRTVRAT